MRGMRIIHWLAAGVILVAILPPLLLGGCAGSGVGFGQPRPRDVYPPAPQISRVIAMGNLRSGPPPSDAQVQLAVFLFGEEPEAPLAFMRPLSIALDRTGLLVCDAALGAVLRWDADRRELVPFALEPRPAQPVAALMAPGGDLLIADVKAAAVIRYDADGRLVRRYGLQAEGGGALRAAEFAGKSDRGETSFPEQRIETSHSPSQRSETSRSPSWQRETSESPAQATARDVFRPAGIACVGDEIWATNAAAHCIEVFDAGTGGHLRSIGARGKQHGLFGSPLGMAQTPEGHVCVVDMLNCRVQIFERGGKHLRNIGGPGDLVGSFGRPKDVAVGPDGTIFVTDAASQRVHVFDTDGRVLMAFGEPSEGIGALSVPGGIAISPTCPIDPPPMPDGFVTEYYVLVAEQLMRPGVRVYAWGRGREAAAKASDAARDSAKSHLAASTAANPHWSPGACGTCHVMENSRPIRMVADSVDRLCLSCHDGVRAKREAHPVGRLAVAKDIEVPRDWPLDDGRLACLTCHDMKRHCSTTVTRPSDNPTLLRAHRPDEPMHFCTQCHKADASWRMSPHQNLDEAGRIVESSCNFCHTQTPALASNGIRRGSPMLHTEDSQLCLTCHTRHWDVSPLGHVDRPVPDEIRRAMVAREMTTERGEADAVEAASRPGGLDLDREPTTMPLAQGRVTCYTCHNPHQAGLFPAHSPLGAVSREENDAHAALRVSSMELCLMCHAK